jgi:lysozyme
MKVSKTGIELIKKHEGFVPTVYSDPAGLPTIGYGTYLNTPELISEYTGTTITEEEATALLVDHVRAKVEPVINAYVDVDINQNQYNALASFIYNLGSGNFKNSTLLSKINSGASESEIRYQFSRWNKATVNGVLTELAGLTTRRSDEANLYFSMPLKKKLFTVQSYR